MKANNIIGLLFLILLLAGCGVNNSLTEKDNEKDTKEFSGTLEVGDLIYSGMDYEWTYDGVVADSIVISTSSGRNRFIPINKNEWTNLPLTKTKKIKIKSINKKTGSIEIDFMKKGE